MASVYEIVYKGTYIRVENQKNKILFSSQYINESIRKNKCSGPEIENFEKELVEKFKLAPSSRKVNKKEELIKIIQDKVPKELNSSEPNAGFFLNLQDEFSSMLTRIKRKCIP